MEVDTDPFATMRHHRSDPNGGRQRVIILEAIEELLAERRQAAGGAARKRASPTEYFVAIMTALEAGDQSHAPEVANSVCFAEMRPDIMPLYVLQLVYLLEMIVEQVDKSLLRFRVKAITSTLATLLRQNFESEATAFLRDLATSVGKVLCAQEVSTAAWASPILLKPLQLLSSCVKHPRPKVRKTSMAAVVELLQLHADGGVTTAAQYVVDGVLAGMAAREDTVGTLHLLVFIKEAAAFLPEKCSTKVVRACLDLLSTDSAVVAQSTLQALKELVKPDGPQISQTLSEQIYASLSDRPPPRLDKDIGVTCAYCDLFAFCMQRLHQLNATHAKAMAPRVVQILVNRCETTHLEIQTVACRALRMVFVTCSTDFSDLNEGTREHLLLAIAEVSKLLEYRYQQSWSSTLPFLGSLFIHFQAAAGSMLDSLLSKLASLHNAITSVNPALGKSFASSIASAIEGLGIERVLATLPVEDEAGIASRRLWLLPLLALHGKRQPASLGFFRERILSCAKKTAERARLPELSESARQDYRGRVIQLWQLLPAFCAEPSDLSRVLPELAPTLAQVLRDQRYPELLHIVCQALRLLVQYVREKPEDVQSLQAISEVATKLLPSLLSILDGTAGDDPANSGKIHALSETLSSYVTVAPKSLTASLFKKLIQKMLSIVQTEGAEGTVTSRKAIVLCELAYAMVPSLDQACVGLLYKVLRPLIRLDTDLALQKRAYRVLSALCEDQREAFLTPDTLQELASMLSSSLLTCNVAARQMRLKLLNAVVKSLDLHSPAHTELLARLVGEVLLCVKDANAKAREAAYQTLITMAEIKQEDDLADFTSMILAAFAAETPQMRSAAVLAEAHLVFHFAPKLPGFRDVLPQILSTVLLLANDPAKEVVKSVVSFIRVCVAACPVDRLEPMLSEIVDRLFLHHVKVPHRAKVKIIFKKLCRKFGYERILELAPTDDKKLIKHIQKQANRGDRTSKAEAATGDGHDGWEAMLRDDEEDSEEENGTSSQRANSETGPRKPVNRGRKRVRDERGPRIRNDGIVDLLDASLLENIQLGDQRRRTRVRRRREEDSSDEDMTFNAEGKLVISRQASDAAASVSTAQAPEGDMMEVEDQAQDGAGDGGDSKGMSRKRAKRNAGLAAPRGRQKDPQGGRNVRSRQGREYRAKKAGGDLKRAKALDPYAYVQLDPKLLSKKRRGEAKRVMAGVIGSKKMRKDARQRGRARKGGRR